MPDLKISELPAATLPLADIDQLPVVQGTGVNAATRRAPVSAVRPRRHPGFVAGKYFDVFSGQLGIGGLFLIAAADTLYLMPFIAQDASVPWLGLAVRISTGGGAGAALKAGVWEIEAATLEPRGLPVAVSNGGTVATGTGMVSCAFAAPWTPVPGRAYAAGFLAAAATPLPTCYAFANTNSLFCNLSGVAPGPSAGGTAQAWSVARSYALDLGALNIAGGLSTVAGQQPMLYAAT
jgi:hypothetical protein